VGEPGLEPGKLPNIDHVYFHDKLELAPLISPSNAKHHNYTDQKTYRKLDRRYFHSLGVPQPYPLHLGSWDTSRPLTTYSSSARDSPYNNEKTHSKDKLRYP
jgi:hypothetical protein